MLPKNITFKAYVSELKKRRKKRKDLKAGTRAADYATYNKWRDFDFGTGESDTEHLRQDDPGGGLD